MARDDHRCVFTTKVDFASLRLGLVDLSSRALRESGGGDILQVAHIISQPLTAGVGGMTQAAHDKVCSQSS